MINFICSLASIHIVSWTDPRVKRKLPIPDFNVRILPDLNVRILPLKKPGLKSRLSRWCQGRQNPQVASTSTLSYHHVNREKSQRRLYDMEVDILLPDVAKRSAARKSIEYQKWRWALPPYKLQRPAHWVPCLRLTWEFWAYSLDNFRRLSSCAPPYYWFRLHLCWPPLFV